MIKIKFVDDFISSKVVDDNYSHIEKVKIAYGMEILLENLIKTVIIIGLAFALGGLKYTLVAILSFTILRFFTFGLHCQSGLMCLLLSVFLDVMSPILIKDIYVGTIPRCILMIIYVFLIFKYAPADTENHPLVKKEVRKQLKTRAVIVSIIYCLLAIFAKPMWFVNILMLMETYVVISILPISYKIFRRRYNNYEEFNDEN